MELKNKDGQLFRIVRRGYDPAQVLECIEEMATTFQKNEEYHKAFQEVLRDEYRKLRRKCDEGEECQRELALRLKAAEEKNRLLTRRLRPLSTINDEFGEIVWDGMKENTKESASPPIVLPESI